MSKIEGIGSGEPQNKKNHVSRRTFLGLSVAATAASATFTLSSTGCDSQELSEVKIIPLSSMAQSVVSIIEPHYLASLVEEFAPYECSLDNEELGLSIIGEFVGEGEDAFVSLVSPLLPTLIVDVGFYDSARQAEVESLGDALGVPVAFYNLEEIGIANVFTDLSQLLEVEFDSEKLQCLEELESMVAKAVAVPDESKFEVLAVGSDVMEVFAEGTDENNLVQRSGSTPVIASGIESDSDIVGSSIFSQGDLMPDIVLLMYPEIGKDYAKDGTNTSVWRTLDVGRIGYVFPAIADSFAWLGEMSPFAKFTVASAWLAALLYPDYFERSHEGLVSQFYETVFGTAPTLDSDADICNALIDEKLPLSKEKHDTEYEEYRLSMDDAAQSILDNIQNSDDPNSYSDEELEEYFRILSEAFGQEVTQEDIDAFIDLVRNS